MARMKDKVAIVTGAAGGIGAATAKLLVENGARVVLADLDQERARALADDLGGEDRAFAAALDLGDEATILAVMDATTTRWGRLDILHNNAADLSPDVSRRDRDIETMDVTLWDRSFRINVRGTMLCCKHALPIMVRQGGGSIVNTASNLGLQGNVIQAAYSATKAAVLQLTRSIATSHGRLGIRCNAVSPGLTLTPAVARDIPPEMRAIVEAETLTPYLGNPEDIAAAVLFLASDEARYITGQNIVVDGGTSIHVPGFNPLRSLISAVDLPSE